MDLTAVEGSLKILFGTRVLTLKNLPSSHRYWEVFDWNNVDILLISL